MKPLLKNLEETKLIGISVRMSFANNKTKDLWTSFMQRRSEIQNSIGRELYSLEIYDSKFFDHFNPTNEFEKWAAVRVNDFNRIPASMNTLIVPLGLYAVFHYTGMPSQASDTYQFIYNQWVPNSEYALDERPHFTVMGENYKGEQPDSEEELWIPIKPR
jgi:AraC family transcriptional regulator